MIIVAVLFLAACGDEGNVSSGTGHEIDDGALANTIGTTRATPVTPVGGHLPAHCPEVFRPVEALVGCSAQSFIDCVCYDPLNPAQVD